MERYVLLAGAHTINFIRTWRKRLQKLREGTDKNDEKGGYAEKNVGEGTAIREKETS